MGLFNFKRRLTVVTMLNDKKVKVSTYVVKQNQEVNLYYKDYDDYKFEGWYENDKLISNEKNPTIIMPKRDSMLVAKAVKIEEPVLDEEVKNEETKSDKKQLVEATSEVKNKEIKKPKKTVINTAPKKDPVFENKNEDKIINKSVEEEKPDAPKIEVPIHRTQTIKEYNEDYSKRRFYYLIDNKFEPIYKDDYLTFSSQTYMIEDYKFEEDYSIRKIIFSKNIKEVGFASFRYCLNLTSVTINDEMENIYNACFWGCRNLKEIHIPESVTYVGSCAFEECPNLTIYINRNCNMKFWHECWNDNNNKVVYEGTLKPGYEDLTLEHRTSFKETNTQEIKDERFIELKDYKPLKQNHKQHNFKYLDFFIINPDECELDVVKLNSLASQEVANNIVHDIKKDPTAKTIIALALAKNSGSMDAAISLIKEAADEDFNKAQNYYAATILDEDQFEDKNKALAYYSRAAFNGSPSSCLKLALLFSSHAEIPFAGIFEPNETLSNFWFKLGSYMGNHKCMLEYALYCLNLGSIGHPIYAFNKDEPRYFLNASKDYDKDSKAYLNDHEQDQLTQQELNNLHKKLNKTSYITFGKYVNEETNVNEPIKWIKVSDNGLFTTFISEKVLFYKPINEEDFEEENYNSLLKYLNTEFYNKAFSEDEKKAIFKENVGELAEYYNELTAKKAQFKLGYVNIPSLTLLVNNMHLINNLGAYDINYEGTSNPAPYWLIEPGMKKNTSITVDSYGRVNLVGTSNKSLKVGVRPSITIYNKYLKEE